MEFSRERRLAGRTWTGDQDDVCAHAISLRDGGCFATATLMNCEFHCARYYEYSQLVPCGYAPLPYGYGLRGDGKTHLFVCHPPPSTFFQCEGCFRRMRESIFALRLISRFLSLVGQLEAVFEQPFAEGGVVAELLEQLRVVRQEGGQYALHGAVMLDACVLLV